jgi:RNA polymerase sigma factor (sigma-70 family)
VAKTGLGGTNAQIALLTHPNSKLRNEAWRTWWNSTEGSKLRGTIYNLAKQYNLTGYEDDILQDTLLSLHIILVKGNFDPDRASLLTFAKGVARICTLKVLNVEFKKTRQKSLDLSNHRIQIQPERQAELNDTLNQIKKAVTPREWHALVLKYVYELSGKETARKIGVSDNHLRQVIFRAKKRSRKALSSREHYRA